MKRLVFFLGILSILSSCQIQQKGETLFKDNGYRNDTVYISGHIKNLPEGHTLRVYYNKWVEGEQVSLKVIPDSLGSFQACVPVINSASILFNYHPRKSSLNLFVEPGERIEIHTDCEKETHSFYGEYAQAHQDVCDYNAYVKTLGLPYVHIEAMDREMTHEEFLARITADWGKKDSLLNAYLEVNPQMSPRAVSQIRLSNLNRFASLLMQRRFTLDFRTKEAFPEDYMQKADSVFRIWPRPYTLMDLTFLRDYLDYYGERKAEMPGTVKMTIDYLNEKKGMALTEEQWKDAAFMGTPEMRAAIGEAYKVLSSLPEYESAVISQNCGGLDAVSMSGDMKELMTAYYYYWCLDGMRKPFAEVNVARFRQQVKNPDLARPVLELQQKYEEIARREMENAASLMTNDHLKDCQTAESLLAGILKPYEGKLVYVDVWGTWCAPCKEQMKHASSIKQAMKEKDVVFLYLANGSPRDSWENVIKEYGLTGKQVVHYNLPDAQQKMLETHFNVKFFPTYLLIDRKGNVVDKNPPQPDSGDKLIGYLNDWLMK